ncbi:folate family ECF transporter S component [Anaerotignum sp.]
MSERKISTTHRLVLMAMLVAIQVILSRWLSINLWNLKIGFAFVPIALAGMLLGPVGAGLTGAVADVIGATLFPSGTFFPGFTLTAFITAFGYGFFLQKKQDMLHILGAVLFSEIVGTILMNTLWISIMYGTPFIPVMIPRLGQAVGMGIVEVIVIKILANYVPQLKKTI